MSVVPARIAAIAAARTKLANLGGGNVLCDMQESNGLARLVLQNADKRNSLTGRMMVQLADAVTELTIWQRGVALIMQGEGHRAFCAGADLLLARDSLRTGQDGALMSALMTDSLDRLMALPLISVAAVHGPAVGGGAELATACDFRVMHRESRIQFVQVNMGVSTGWGGTARLTQLLGRQKALRALAWAEPITAEVALTCGLADLVTDAGETASEAALRFLQPVLAQSNWQALRAAKLAVAAADGVDQQSVIGEQAAFTSVWGSEANRRILGQGSASRPG